MRRENSPFTLTRLLRGLLGSVSGMAFATAAMAGPVGGNVAAGSADITGQGTSAVTVNQNSDRVVIDWANFDTQSHERVDFLQPGSHSIALNRITNGSATQFDGALRANGRVILMNANGVIFGPNSTVDVNSLVATTANISNDAFMQGGDQLKFDQPGNPNAVIVNNGHITAKEAGLVGFVAPNVINNGVINAKLGKIHLASGDRFTYDLYGDGLVEIAAGDAVNKQLVENNGALHADGGTIALTAVQARNAVDNVIRNNGAIEAKTVSQKNGVIILGGSKKIEQSGRIEASGKQSGEKGGTVKLGADHIVLAQGSVIDTSGDVGGGTVLVGGEYKGRRLEDDVQQYGLVTAQNVTMENGASIVNNAITSGDGGRTILWADDRTVFAGSIQAKGGATGGNGGFVETSGKNELKVTGLVSLLAPTEGQSGGGKVGTWLLDPTDITIYNRSGSGNGTNTFTTAQLETMSASANISLVADNNLTLDMTNDTLTVAANRDISLTATSGTISSNSGGTIVTSGTGSITLTAGTDINFANDLSLTSTGTGSIVFSTKRNIGIWGGGDITTNGGNIVLGADSDTSGGGTIQISGPTALLSNGGNITLGGGANPLTGYAQQYDNVSLAGILLESFLATGPSTTIINAGGGNISLRGKGWADASATQARGISIKGASVLTTGSGNIVIDGISGGISSGTSSNLFGITMSRGNNGIDALISAVNGSISISGTSTQSSNNSPGLRLSAASIVSTGSGDITLTAMNASGGSGYFQSDGNGTPAVIGGPSASGRISVISDIASLTLSLPTFQTTGDIVIRPYSVGTTVGIGSGTGTLGITDAWLNNITTGGTLWLGGYGLTGAETGYWNSSGLMTLNTTRSFANNVNFLSGANIISGAAGTITLTSVASTVLHAVGDILISHDTDFTSTGTGSVTLRANGTISYTGSGDITTAGGAITLNSDRDANNSGAIYLGTGTNVTSGGGAITLGGGATPTTGYATGLSGYSNGVYLAGTLNANGAAAGGNIIVNGKGWANSTDTASSVTAANGIMVSVGTVQTNFAGTLTMAGLGGGTGASSNNTGMYLISGSTLSAVNGTITVNVTGNLGASLLFSGSGTNKITSTGSGDINVTTSQNNITMASTAGGFFSTSGNITLSTNYLSNNGNGGTIGGNAATGTITLITDGTNLDYTNLSVKTTGAVIIKPLTATTSINVATGSAALYLPTNFLNSIVASSITIGSNTVNGAMTIGAYSNWSAPVSFLTNNGNITFAGNQTSAFDLTAQTFGTANILTSAVGSVILSGTGNVLLSSASDITFGNDYDLTSTGTGSVTLRANGNIVYTASGDITTTSGAITVNSDRDANSNGAISLGAGTVLTTTGGNITLGGGTSPTTTAAVGNASYNQGIALTSATLNAAGGTITLTGRGYALGGGVTHAGAIGVKMDASSLTVTGSGAITVTGTGAGTTTGYGVDILNTSSINAVNGSISVTGTGGAGSTADNPGILFSGGGVNTINSTGTGSITVTGTGGGSSGSTSNQGVLINTGAGGGILSKDGSVTVTGIAGYGGTGTGSYGIAGGSSPLIGGPTATGTITLIVDTTVMTTPIQTTGDVIIRPYTAGTTVGVGTGTGATLSLTDTFLNSVTYGGTLWLGGYGLTGAETGYWNSSGQMTLNTTRSFSKNVNFISGNNIISGVNSTITLTSAASTVLYALGDINISHDLDFTATGTGSVTQRANGNIIYTGSGDITTAGGAITLNSDRDESGDGVIRLLGTTVIASGGGNITLGGGANPVTTAATGNVTYKVGVDLSSASLDAQGGNIVLNGRGYTNASCSNNCYGIKINNASISTSGTGAIAVNGIGGGVGSTIYNHAIQIVGTSTITAVNGNISITGQVMETGGGSAGISILGGSISTSIGTGNVILTDKSGPAAGVGLEIASGASTISSGGTITYIGDKIQTSATTHTWTAAGDVIIRPYTAGTTVGIGSGAGTLSIYDTFLNNISPGAGGTLWLGGYGLTGAETGYWNSSGVMTVSTTRSFSKNVNFISGNNIVSGAASTITLTGTASTVLYALGNISIAHDLDFTATGTGSVTLRANGNIAYTGSGDITTAGGAITLNSDRDANNDGNITLGTGTTLTSNGGNITLGGGANPATTAAAASASSNHGIILYGSVMTAGAGNISVRGTSDASKSNSYGIQTNGDSITTTSGSITLSGTNYGANNSQGVFLNAVTVQSTTGDINITGDADASVVGQYDTYLWNNTSILSTTGNITVTAIGKLYASGTGVATIGNGTTSGRISLIADSITNGTTNYAVQTTGDVVVRPYTAGTTVGIGSGAGTLNISDAFLNTITTGSTLWLGGYGLTGLETGYWNSSGVMTLNSTRSFSKNVNFISGNNIVSGGASTITLTGTASTVLYALGDINITHDLDFTASGTGSITERANGNIVYSASGDITTTGGAIILNSDRDANNDGMINLNGGTVLTSNGGNITLGGGANPATTAAVGNATYLQGILIYGAVLDARGTTAGGNIVMNGRGYALNTSSAAHGILLDNTGSVVQTSHSGNITMTGTGGGTGAAFTSIGVFTRINAVVTAVNGTITVTGTGGNGTGGDNAGIVLSSSGANKFESTGTGDIVMNGTGGGGAGTHGVTFNAVSGGGALSKNGTITVTGIAGAGSGSFGMSFGVNSSTIGGVNATNNISLIANTLSSNPSTIQTTGDIIIRPYTAGTTVGIASGAGTLNISSAILGVVNVGGTLWLGGYGLTGAETGYWNSSGLMTIFSNDTFAKNVNFISGNNIVSGGASTITLTGAASTILSAQGDILMGHDLDLTSTGTGSITLRANNTISYTASGDITTAGGAITLNSDRDANGSGAINLGSGTFLTSGGGNITLGGGATPGTVAAYGATGYNSGITLTTATIDASGASSGGTITMVGTGNAAGTGTNVNLDGAHGIFLNNATVQTSHNGNVTLIGIGTGTTASTGEGVRVYNTSLVSTANGNLSITGTGSNIVNTGVNKYGVSLSSSGTNILRSTGLGNVNIAGTGGTSAGSNDGVVVNSVGGGIYANSGITTIIGNAGLGGSGTSMVVGALVGTGTTTGAINIIADTMAGAPTVTTTGTVTLRPVNGGTSIGIAGAAGTLQLTSTLLNAISASTIVVGSSTNDHLITANAYTWNANASLLSKSFDIVLNGLQTGALNKNFSAAITSGTGKITIGAGGGVTTTGTGTITLNTANQITTTGAGGLTSASGNIGLTATNGIVLSHATPITSTSGNINFNSALTSTASQVFNAGTGTITTAAMAMGANNLTLTADDLVIGGALSGTGTLTLQPGSTSRVVCVNGTGATYCTGGFFSLSTAEIANLSDGWAGITIGRSDGTGTMEIGATSWTDPVTFLNNFRTQINGNLTATGNGSLTVNAGSGGWVNFNGSPVTISTAGTNVAFTAGGTGSVSYNTTINTSGGNVSLSLPLNLPSAIAAGNTLSINAGSGAVSLSTIANGSTSYQTNLTVNAGTITLNGALGSGNGMGDVNLTATNSMSLPAITTAAGKTLNAIVTGAGNAITTTGAIATGTGGNITLTADDLVLGGNLSGTGTLTLQPNAASRSVCVNSVSANCTASYLNLSTAEIAYFQDGWSGITIGRSDGTGTVSVGASNWTDPLMVKNNFRTEIGGVVAGTGNASFNFATGSGGSINLNGATISTAGQAVTLGGSTSTSVLVNTGTGSSITTNGGAVTLPGDIVFPSSATNDRTLSIDAGTGNVSLKGLVNMLSTYTPSLTVNANAITMSGAMGVTNGMGNLTLTSVNSLTLPTITTAAGKTVSVTVTGVGNNITTSGAIATGAGGNITLTADDLVIGHALSGTGTVTLRPSGTSRNVCINNTSSANCLSSNLNLSTAEIAYLTNGWSGIVIGSNSNTAAMEVNNISGSVTFTDPVVFLNNGAIYLYNTISGVGDASLVFNAGASNGVFMQSAYGTTISTKGKDISFINNGTRIYSAVTIDSSNGNISFGTNGVNGGASTSNSLVINAGTGTITAPGGFTNNSSASNPFTVSLSANAFSFGSGAWGGTYGLGDVTLNSVASMSLPGATTFAGKNFNAIVTGAGNSITTTGAIATGTGGNITLTADDLVIGGALSGTGTLTLQPNSTSQGICINSTGGAYCGGPYLGLSTSEVAYLTDGWSGINIGRTDGAVTYVVGSTTWTDPVTFRNNYRVAAGGTIAGTGNASLNFSLGSAGWINLDGGSFTTNGQAITFTSPGGAGLGVNANTTMTTNNGAITISMPNVYLAGSSPGATLTLNAGTGLISLPTFTNATPGLNAFNITASGLGITSGSMTSVGDVTLTSVNSLSLPAITTTAGKTVSATVTGAGNSITTGGAISTGAGGNITLTADDLVIGHALSGTGILTLQPNSDSRVVCVSRVSASCVNNFDISNAELSYFTDGWSGIRIGRTTSTASNYIGTSTWTDPVAFRGTGSRDINGSLTGTGNAAFDFTGGFNSGGTGYDITTAGGSITISTAVMFGNTFNTNGGAVNINLLRIWDTAATNAFTLNTGGGAVTIGTLNAQNGTASGKNVVLNSGSGAMNFTGAADGAFNVDATAGSITMASAWGTTTNLGNVTLTAANAISSAGLTTIAGKNLNATVTGAGGVITTTGAIATGTGGNITLTADDLVIGGALSGTGVLTLQPNASNRVVCVGWTTGNCSGGYFGLSTAEITNFTDGWSGITIGRSDGSVTTELGPTSWTDPVTFLNNYRTQINGNLTATGNGSFTLNAGSSGWTNFNAVGLVITTNGQNVVFAGGTTVNLNGNTTINTNNGNVSFNNAISLNPNTAATSVNTLSINAGTGSVALPSIVNNSSYAFNLGAAGASITSAGAWGGTYGMGDVTLTSVNSLTLPAITTAAGKTVSATVTGAGNSITTGGAIATGTGGNITLAADDLVIGHALSGTGTVTLQPYTAGRVVCVNYTSGACASNNLGLSTAEIAFLTDGWSLIALGHSNNATAGPTNLGAITWNDSVRLLGNNKTLYGNQVLNGATSGFTSLNNGLNMQGYNITTAGGAVSLSNNLTPDGATITTNGGNFTQDTGQISLRSNGGMTVNTSGGAIVINPVSDSGTSSAGKTLTLNAGTGNVTMNGSNNAAADVVVTGATITAGVMGNTSAVGSVTLNAVNAISLPSITTTAGKTVAVTVTGAGNAITTTGAIATGTGGNITLAADDLVIGGALSGTGTLTLQPNSNSRNICVNDPGAAACASNVLGLSTAELAYLTDGWTGINIGSNSGTGTTYIGTASFADPVNFRVPNTTYLDGTLTGTGNASFNTAGEVYGRNGSIVTAGQAVTLNSATVEDGMSITTNGGAISTAGRLRISSTTNSLAAVTLSSGGGNITINGVLSETGTGSVVGKNVTLDAGAGTVALGNTYNGNYNLILNGATITTNGAWGATTPVGNVTVTSVNSLSLPTITTAAGKTLNATVTGAGNSITTTGAIATGAGGNITLTADDLVVGGALSGTGTVTLRPNSTNQVVCVNGTGDVYCTGSYLSLSNSEIANLSDGWSGITVGRSDNVGTMVIGATSWTDPVTFLNNYRAQINGDLTATGNGSLTINAGSGGWVNFNPASLLISTAGTSVSFIAGNNSTLNKDMTINTNGGNVSLSLSSLSLPSVTTASRTLAINAGSGTVSLPVITNSSTNYQPNLVVTAGSIALSGALGSGNGMGDISLTATNSISLPAITTAAGKTVSVTATGAGNSITTTGAIATGTGGNITLTSDDVVIGGALSGTGTLTLRPNSLSRVVKVNDGLDNGTAYFLDNTELARLTNGWNLVNIGRSDSVAALRLGVSSWVDPIVFNSGSSVDVLGDVTGTDNASLTTAGNGAANLYSNMTTAGGKIDLSNSGYVYTTGAGTTLSTNGGNILLKDINLGSLTGSGAMNVLSGGGNITVNGGIGTNSSSTGKLVNLNAGTGNVLLNSTVNGTGDVTLTGNAITASGIMGSAGTRLGTVTLNSTGDLSLPTIYASNIVANVSGAGNKITTGTLSAGTGGNVTLTADDVVIGGPVSGTGTLTLQPNSVSRVVNINRGTADGSNFNLSTADVAQLADGWSGILVGRTNSTADINLDNSTWTDPLTLRGYSGYTNLYGFTGTGNGALTAAGAYTPVSLAGNITTGGGAVTLNNGSSQMFLNSGNITTNGGAFSMTGPLVYNAGNTGGFALSTSGGNITLGTISESGGSAAGKTMNFNAGNGAILFGGTVNTAANVTASANTITANNIWGGTTALGNVSLNSVSGLDLKSITANTIVAQATGATGDITLSSGTRLAATGAGNALVLSAARNFTNLSDASALSTPAGRWLVYSKNLVNNTRGGLLPNAAALYGKTYASDAPATIGAGNRFIFSDAAGTAPVITLVADNQTKVYGSVNGSLTYTINGTFGAGDNFANSFSGAPAITTAVTTGSNAGSYAITLANGTLSSNLGYQVVYQNGTYTVDKANLLITANDQIKAYGTSFVFTGREYAVQGLVNGNTVSRVALSSPGADVLAPASSVPYVISASGATGTGLSNYNITYVTGKLSINLTSAGDTPSILPNYKQVFSPTADTSVKIATSVDNNEQPSSIIVTQMSPSAVKTYNCLYTVVGFADMDVGVNGSCK